MCGIAGFADTAASVSAETLAAASRAIAHRGPDDDGMKVLPLREGRGTVGLANRRLAILDLSPAGHQPMQDPETGNWIVYNGEAFNFQQVRAKLEARGIRFTSHSDTEVLLKAYGVLGDNFLEDFRGMFAIAIWDEKAQRLFLARDRLGKKPLYYFRKDGLLLFASEVRALLATGLVPRKINPHAVEQYLAFGSVSDPDTLVEGVSALPRGSCLTWQAGRVEIRKYWDLAQVATKPNPDASSEDAVLQKLKPLLTEAINLRMVSDVEVGVFLSGGIDSSALVAALAGRERKKINTFSVVFKEADYSEAPFSRLVAQRFGTEHHEITLSGEDFLESVPDAIAAMDQPSLDGFNTFTISRAVRRAGLKVALSGQGGDEIFGGYHSFQAVPMLEKLQRAKRWVPAVVRSAAASAISAGINSDHGRKIAVLVQGNGFLVHPYFVARMLFVPKEGRRLLRNPTDRLFKEDLPAAVAPALHLDAVNRVSYLELTNYMANTLLRDGDCMSMATGLELRTPLLDHLLVEFVITIPGAMKMDAKTPKHLLVKSMEGLLPDEIVHRPKKGFTLPFEHWLRGPLRDTVEKALAAVGGGPLGQVLDGPATAHVWQTFLAAKTAWTRPWSLYVLDRWCRMHSMESGSERA